VAGQYFTGHSGLKIRTKHLLHKDSVPFPASNIYSTGHMSWLMLVSESRCFTYVRLRCFPKLFKQSEQVFSFQNFK